MNANCCLLVHSEGRPAARLLLSRPRARLGRHEACGLRVVHPEVADHAANLEFRNGLLWFQNLNPYDVYLGADRVATRAWHPWEPGATLRLSRSVAIDLLAADAAAQRDAGRVSAAGQQAAPAAGQARQAKARVQIAVIAGCAAVAAVALSRPALEARTSGDSVAQLAAELMARPAPSGDDRATLALLQAAWEADRRHGRARAAALEGAFRQLLDHRPIRTARQGTLEDRIRAAAAARLAALAEGGR